MVEEGGLRCSCPERMCANQGLSAGLHSYVTQLAGQMRHCQRSTRVCSLPPSPYLQGELRVLDFQDGRKKDIRQKFLREFKRTSSERGLKLRHSVDKEQPNADGDAG